MKIADLEDYLADALEGYLYTLLDTESWTCGEDGCPGAHPARGDSDLVCGRSFHDLGFTADHFSSDALAQAEDDVVDFVLCQWRYLPHRTPGAVGRDLLLTRNRHRHGAGFRDGDYPGHGQALTDAAHAYSEVSVSLSARGGSLIII